MRASLLALLLLFTITISAQQAEYSRVKIYTSDAGMNQLALAGITIDHGEYKQGCCFTTDLSAAEISRVQSLGFNYEILIDDVQAHYLNRNISGDRVSNESTQAINCTSGPSFTTPTNFTLGSMGGFFTLAEIYWHMDNMATLYPNLVKSRQAIDSTNTTFEGRMVYWMKISDNANTDEAEPEMVYSAAHHAREPAGVSQLILYMYYLLENYNTNPEIQYLVNNTELFFVPCVNPDGYNYNATTNPNGGGMWRKNRLDHGNGDYGVDLNRNYAYNWGYDNSGSSPLTSSDTYRGSSPASEPEVQMMETLCAHHNFRIAINYHTYGNLLICPWGYAPSTYTPDANTFNAWGPILTRYNGYAFGTADQTVGYVVNGSSDDWMYGDQVTKPKIMAMTPEAGDQNDGFWPATNRIIDICKANIPMDLYAAKLLLAYAEIENTDGKYISGSAGYFHFDVQRLGLDSPAVYTVSIQPISSEITAVGAPRTFSSLAITQTVSDSISYTVNTSTPEGTLLTYAVELSNGTFTWRDTISRLYGVPTIVFSSTGSSMNGWSSAGGWGVTTEQFVSAPSSLTDSPFASYSPGSTVAMPMTQSVSLANAISAHLVFQTRYELEAGYDFAQVEVSSDNGVTWTPLCGKYTTNNNALDNGDPVYNGYRTSWVKEDMSLDDYIGMNILVRYRLESDFGVEYDGIYVDDVVIEVLDTAANSISEYANTTVMGQNIPNPANEETFIPLSTTNASVIEIYSQFGQLVMVQNVNAGSNGIFVNTSSLAQGVYFYRLNENGVSTETRKMTIVR